MRKVVKSAFRHFKLMDHWILVISTLTSLLSIVLLHAILQSGYENTLEISRRNLLVQGAAIVIGVITVIILSLTDYRSLMKTWMIHVPASYGLVLLTFFMGVGAVARPDDKRWLIVPWIDVWFQPAEFLKISFILAFSLHIVNLGDSLNRPGNILTLFIHALVPVVLIHLQGDDGTALLIAAIAITMIFAAGISWKYMVPAALATILMIPIGWTYLLSSFQKERILTLLNQATADPMGEYFQQYRAKIAAASGGITGVGLLNTNHVYVYVPKMHTDFIFSFLCESLGFMGSFGLLLAMALLCFKILYNSSRALDSSGRLICTGVFAMLLFQIAVNVGMCLSLLPVIGNPFPFLSYGGSSMVINFLGIGLVQSVYMRQAGGIFSGA